MVNDNFSSNIDARRSPYLGRLAGALVTGVLIFSVAGCGKKEQTKAEEKAAADKNIRSNVIVGEKVKALDMAKAMEAEANKAAAKVGEAADAASK